MYAPIITSPSSGWYTIEGVEGLDGNWRKADFIPLFRKREEYYIDKFSELLAEKEEEFNEYSKNMKHIAIQIITF